MEVVADVQSSQSEDGFVVGILTRAMIENIATLTACVVTILGLYALDAGYFSAIGFVFLLNINYIKKKAVEPNERF